MIFAQKFYCKLWLKTWKFGRVVSAIVIFRVRFFEGVQVRLRFGSRHSPKGILDALGFSELPNTIFEVLEFFRRAFLTVLHEIPAGTELGPEPEPNLGLSQILYVKPFSIRK